MKLLTEMVDGSPVFFAMLGEHPGVERVLSHDAMAAHALMLALRCEAPGVYARAIAKADSILREWGFDSGEAE